jgi:hypothetical protein
LHSYEDEEWNFQEAMSTHEPEEANGDALVLFATTFDVCRHVWFIIPPNNLCIHVNITHTKASIVLLK